MSNNNLNKITTNENSHKSIVKAIGVFGSMQFFKLLIGLVTTKFAAIFLGPSGIGLLGLIKNALNVITSITSFGFSTVSIKEIAVNLNDTDKSKLQKSIQVVKRTGLYLGILGCVVTLILSITLSSWIFNDSSKFYWFIILSVNFIFTSYGTAYGAILQGMRLMKSIALSSIISSLLSALITIPLYFYLGKEGIIPSIISGSFIALLVNIHFTRNLQKKRIKTSFSIYIKEASPMLKLGFFLSLNIIFGHICNFFIRLYLDKFSNSEEVLGLFEASIVILTSYVGLIFTAMSVDFFPRLTSVQHNNNQVKSLVNKQIEVALLIVTPLILFLYLSAPFVLKLLYSSSFVKVSEIFVFGLFAIILKTVLWPLSYIILAKDNKVQYFKQELLGDFLNISLTILCYKFYNLKGIGLATVINFVIYGIYLYLYVHKKYQFNLTSEAFKIFTISVILGVLCIISSLILSSIPQLVFFFILVSISLIYSFIKLNKKIDLIYYLKKKFKINL